ncbi:hypothetical protein WKT02_04080 [Erysipelotrichaceae bacterium HCN-30851]
MKKLIALAIIGITFFPCIEIKAYDTLYTNMKEPASNIKPRADVKKWIYKIIDGRLYKRLLNSSTNKWETDWILV